MRYRVLEILPVFTASKTDQYWLQTVFRKRNEKIDSLYLRHFGLLEDPLGQGPHRGPWTFHERFHTTPESPRDLSGPLVQSSGTVTWDPS